MKSSLPPLASPHGHETRAPRLDFTGEGVELEVPLSLRTLFVYTLLEFSTPLSLCLFACSVIGTLLLSIALLSFGRALGWWIIPLLLLVCSWGYGAWMAPLKFIARLLGQRRCIIELSPQGWEKRYVGRNALYSWPKLVWVFEWREHVWLSTFASGCYIPAQAFASRDECQLFLFIVRTMKEHPASWLPTWNGLLLGARTAERVNQQTS